MTFRRIATAIAIPLVIAGVGIGSSVDKSPRVTLTAGHDFSITGTISSAPNVPAPALLYPGTSRYLILTVHNPFAVPISVRSVQTSALPASRACPASDLDLSQASFTGSRFVPAHGNVAIPVPVRMANAGNQDRCQGVTFPLRFSGTAIYARVVPTRTRIVSSMNPSRIGRSVSYTATVTAAHRPTGTVSFTDAGRTVCAMVPVTPAGRAICRPAPYRAAGKHPIIAVFTDSGGTFSRSRSAALIESVTAGPVSCYQGIHIDCTVVSP